MFSARDLLLRSPTREAVERSTSLWASQEGASEFSIIWGVYGASEIVSREAQRDRYWPVPDLPAGRGMSAVGFNRKYVIAQAKGRLLTRNGRVL